MGGGRLGAERRAAGEGRRVHVLFLGANTSAMMGLRRTIRGRQDAPLPTPTDPTRPEWNQAYTSFVQDVADKYEREIERERRGEP